jgi:hypothetical protein
MVPVKHQRFETAFSAPKPRLPPQKCTKTGGIKSNF